MKYYQKLGLEHIDGLISQLTATNKASEIQLKIMTETLITLRVHHERLCDLEDQVLAILEQAKPK